MAAKRKQKIRMSEKEFARVAAATCSGWSRRSLGVAHALLVEGTPLSAAAATYKMSRQQANIVRNRFVAKAATCGNTGGGVGWTITTVTRAVRKFLSFGRAREGK